MLSSPKLQKIIVQNTLINGVIYLGSIFLYEFFANIGLTSLIHSDNAENNMFIAPILVFLRIFFSLIYNAWILIIYIIAMTLSTFWVQDIFDELIAIKLARLEGGQKVKNPGKYLHKMQGLETKASAKQKTVDLI